LAEVAPVADPIEGLRRVCESFRQFVLANPVLAQTMFSRPFVDFAPTVEDNKAGIGVSKVFVQRSRAAVDAKLLAGDPTDIAHLFFAFAEGLAAAESARRLGGSKQAVDRRWRLGLDVLIQGLTPSPASGARPSGRRRQTTSARAASSGRS
jgi:hypothetical protein